MSARLACARSNAARTPARCSSVSSPRYPLVAISLPATTANSSTSAGSPPPTGPGPSALHAHAVASIPASASRSLSLPCMVAFLSCRGIPMWPAQDGTARGGGSLSAGAPAFGRHLEPLEREPRDDDAAHERPRPERARGLPGARRNYGLRDLAARRVHSEPDRLDLPGPFRDRERERRPGVPCPHLVGVHPVPARRGALHEQEQDRGARRAPGGGLRRAPGLPVPAAFG